LNAHNMIDPMGRVATADDNAAARLVDSPSPWLGNCALRMAVLG